MIIVGITGTLGAGKGTIVDFLVSHYNFKHYSVREYLIEEINRRNLPVNRDSMVVVANDLRKNNSPAFIIDELYKKAINNNQNCIIESIRTPGEVVSLKNKENFMLLAVDAAPEVRYKRIIERASETDNVSFETFLENEEREFDTCDPHKQNLRKCIEIADYHIDNNGSVDDLYKEIEKIIENHE